MTGINMVHASYRYPLTDLISGNVQLMFWDSVLSDSAVIEHIRAGRLRAIAVTSATRSGALPDVPTVGEFVPGYEAGAWIGIGAPRNIPVQVIEELNKEINAGLVDLMMKEWVSSRSYTTLPGSPSDFYRLITAETEKWRKVIQAANIKPD
jgi:tripartite-type tricarboxylate transporter receptor subunit TctC